MLMASRRSEVFAILRSYGFYNFRRGARNHYMADHDKLAKPVVFPCTPGSMWTINDLEREIRRKLGLSNLGREAVVGERREKKKPQPTPQQRREPVPPYSAVRKRHDELAELDALMRQRP